LSFLAGCVQVWTGARWQTACGQSSDDGPTVSCD